MCRLCSERIVAPELEIGYSESFSNLLSSPQASVFAVGGLPIRDCNDSQFLYSSTSIYMHIYLEVNFVPLALDQEVGEPPI